MKFVTTVNLILENIETQKHKWEIRYNGKKYVTLAYSKKSALANIGVRIAREENIRREFYPRFIKKVLDGGYAKLIEEKCWKGYKKIGMKKKGKRTVPNCVKKNK